jgi:hypothetical protein
MLSNTTHIPEVSVPHGNSSRTECNIHVDNDFRAVEQICLVWGSSISTGPVES